MSGPCLMRRICLELEEQFRGIVGRYQLLEDSTVQMPISDTLTRELIQSLSNKMPALINYETVTQERIEQLNEQLNKQLGQKQGTMGKVKESEMQEAMQVLQYERQMFHEAIREAQTQKEQMQSNIDVLRQELRRTIEEMEVLVKEGKKIQQQRDELVLIVRGEHMKSETLDRELMDLLIKYEDSQLKLVERDSSLMDVLQKCKQTEIAVQLERQKCMNIKNESDKENERLQTALQQSIAKTELTVTNILERSEAEANVLRGQILERDQQITYLEQQYLETKETVAVNQLNHRRKLSNLQQQHDKQSEEWRVIQGKKMNQVQKMHSEIQNKIQRKTVLLQQALSEMKKKYKQAKQEIDRLYESLQLQIKKEMELKLKQSEWSECMDKIKDSNGEMQLKMDLMEQNSKLKDTAIRGLERENKKHQRERQECVAKLKKIVSEVNTVKNGERELKTAILEQTNWLKDQIAQAIQGLRNYSELVRLQNVHMENVETKLTQQKQNIEQQCAVSQSQLKQCQSQLKQCQSQLKQCQQDLSNSQRRICQLAQNMDDKMKERETEKVGLESALHSAKNEIYKLNSLLDSHNYKSQFAVGIPQARMEQQRVRMEALQREYQSLKRADLLPQ